MSESNPEQSSPSQLHKEWQFYCREQVKQRVLADVLMRFIAGLHELQSRGVPTALTYATPEAVEEALQEGVLFFQTSHQLYAQLAKDAREAFDTAAQQN
jgi:hypothetical protein